MSSLSTVNPDSSNTRGHAFEQNVISGGAVHFGDTYYITSEREVGKVAAPWQVRMQDPHRRFVEPASPKSLYFVPRCSTTHFTGRSTQLKQIRENLTAPAPSVTAHRHRIIVLRGLGGSGKSQVCLRYAELNRDTYWATVWIDASNRSSAEAGYAYLGEQTGFGPTWTAGKYWLSQSSRPWLLILDNADDLQMDVSELFPSGKTGHIIITTRIPDLCIHATAGHLEFERMEPEEAIELLLRSAYADVSPNNYDSQQTAAAKGIADALGYLAIALNHAGATIRRKIYTIEEYLHLYLGDRHRLFNSRSISREEINVITTWEIPFKRIEQEQASDCQDAVVLMCIFAFLHFDSIPNDLFQDIWSEREKSPACFNGLPDLLKSGSDRRLRQALVVLSDFSLISVDSEHRTCSLHPVVHQWAKSRINSDDKMVAWLQCTLCLLSCCNPETFTAARGMSILPHIEYCLEVTNKHAPSLLTTHQGINQLQRFAAMFAANGAWKRALPILEKVQEFRVNKLGWWHEDTLTTQRNLAHCHWNLFQVEAALSVQLKIQRARWYLRPSLRDWTRFMKPEHVLYCLALDDLTQTLWLAGFTSQSCMTGRRSVEGLRKRLGEEDPRTWNAMFNLGRTYRHAGELDAAYKLLSFAFRKRRQYLGSSHPDTLMAQSELGMSYWAQGKQLALAQHIITNVRDLRTKVLGRDHAYTLWSCNDLSKILCARNRPLEAVQILEEIVPIVAQTLGRDHVGMHMTKGNLAVAYALCKDWVKAESILIEMLKVVDQNHRDWFDFMYGFVRVESELGHFEEAKETCDKILRKVSAKGEASSRFRSTVELLGSVYFRSGDLHELNALRLHYPWISEDHIKQPPPPTMLSDSS